MKKLSLLILIAASIFIINGCNNASNKQKIMYNNDTLIAQDGDSFSFTNRVGETSELKMEIQYDNFFGSETIWNINVEKQGELKIEFDSSVKGGKFKGVLISQESEITNIFEGSKKGSYMIIVPKGKYRFKIIGNDSDGKVMVGLKLDKDMSSTVIKFD